MREDLQVVTLHIEAKELREHTSIAKFSYMNFGEFFFENLDHFRIGEAAYIKNYFL